VGIFLVALISSVLHHLIVPHRCGGPRDLHPSQAHPVGKVRRSWRIQSGRKSKGQQGRDFMFLYTKSNFRQKKKSATYTNAGENQTERRKKQPVPGTLGPFTNWQR
jgi:hypothetical protein